jgi:hypothetical protein
LVVTGGTLVALLTTVEWPAARVRLRDKSGTTGGQVEDGKSQPAAATVVARHV